MTWWGRRKGDKDPPKPVMKDYKLDDPAASPTAGANVIDFPQKQKIPPENRLAVHQLLDKILDELDEDEYLHLVIEVCGSSDDDVA